MSTLCRIYIPNLTSKTDIREDANRHKVFARLSIGLPRRTPASEAPFLDALQTLGIGGSEGGAVFGVLFLQTDLFLQVGNVDDLVQSRSNSRVQHFKI